MASRDNFNARVRDTIARRAGFVCANPDCRQPTSGPRSDPDKHVDIGVAAHITAAAPGGPRYDSELSKGARKSASNGLWLCQNCAKLIDNDPAKFTIDLLQHWKRTVEREAEKAIQTGRPSKPDPELRKKSPKGHTLSKIVFRDGAKIPDQTMLKLTFEGRAGRMTADLQLPGQSKPTRFRHLPFKNEVMELPVPLVFLASAIEDEKRVQSVADELLQQGVMTWFIRKDLLAGSHRSRAVAEAIADANRVIVFLSKASEASGAWLQRQLQWALEEQKRKPDQERYIVPVRLDECQVPAELQEIQWLDSWVEGWGDQLIASLRAP